MDCLKDRVWDAMRTADNLKLESVAADDKAVTFRCSFDLVLDRDAYSILAKNAEQKRRTVASTLRRLVQYGFKICFSDEQDNET